MKFIQPIRAKRVPKAKPLRKVPEQTVTILKNRLLVERKHIISQSNQLKVLGGVLLCPIACVEEICKRVDYISELSDLTKVPGIRLQFARKFFDILTDVLNI